MAYFTEPMSEEFRKAIEEAMKELQEPDKKKKRLSKKNREELK